jgi:uncharacterized protein YciI
VDRPGDDSRSDPKETTVRLLYFYFMKDHPDRVRAIAPEHAAYWRGIGLDGYFGGPFVDRSSGLIIFDGDSLEQAQHLVVRDPFLQKDLLQDHWVKEWMVESPDVGQAETHR